MTSNESNDLRNTLNTLWQQLAANPRNRALAFANILWHRDEPQLRQLYTDLIAQHTPLGEERSQALRLLSRPALVKPQPLAVVPQPVVSYLRVEPELGRLSIAVGCAAELRLWVIGREITRSEQGSGVISKTQLSERLARMGIVYTRRHFNRLVAQGSGLFWRIHQKRLYLGSIIKVSQALSRQAQEQGVTLHTNLPGVRELLVDVSGTLERFEALLYAAWLASRGQSETLTIARDTLSGLFHRCANTIRRWEQTRLKDIVIVRPNFAQCSDVARYFPYLPSHARAYAAQVVFNGQLQTVIRLRWQLPNTYTALIEPHTHKGQAGKVRRAMNADLPADTKRGGSCRLYLASPEALKRRYRSLKFRLGQLGDVNRPVYVYLGEHRRTRQGMFEITNSGLVFTEANERLAPKYERRLFRQQQQQRRQFLAGVRQPLEG